MAGKNAEKKNNYNHLRINNYDIYMYTAAALCIVDTLDVMVLENIYIIFGS
jgi:hypothetical protein